MASKTIATILSLQDKMTPKLSDLQKEINKLPTAQKNAAKQWQTTARAFESDVKKMQTAAKNLVVDIGKIGLAAAGGIVIGAGTIGFTEAINMEGYKMQLETAVKDTEKAGLLMADAIKLANATPFEGGELVEATAMFEALGLSSQKWLAITGDMAAGTNKDLIQATEAIIDAQSGELERLKEFGITKAMITEKANEMWTDANVVSATGSINDQEKFMEALMTIMEDKYVGGMEKQSTTLKGIWSTITGVTKNSLSTIIGMQSDGSILEGSVLDIIKDKAMELAETLQTWQADGTLQKISDDFTEGFNAALDFANNGLTAVKDALKWVEENSELVTTATYLMVGAFGAFKTLQFAGFLVDVYKNLKTLVVGYNAVTTATNLATAAKTAETAAWYANPTTWIIAGIILGIAQLAYQVWHVTQLWDEFLVNLGKMATIIQREFVVVQDFFAGLWEGIKTGFTSFINFLIDGINLFLTPFKAVTGLLANIPGLEFMASVSEVEIPKFALGTQYFMGGLAQINERGGEIVNLPNGSKVIPHSLSKKEVQTKSGNTFNIYITTKGDEGADKIAEKIVKKIKEVI